MSPSSSNPWAAAIRRRRRRRTAAFVAVLLPTLGAWFVVGPVALAIPAGAAAVRVGREVWRVRRRPPVRPDVRQRLSRIALLIVFAYDAEVIRRAIGYARAARPSWLEAVTVQRPDAASAERVARLLNAWEREAVPITLRVLDTGLSRSISDSIIVYTETLQGPGQRPGEVWFFVPVAVSPRWSNRIRRAVSILGFRGRLMLYRNAQVFSVPTEVRPPAPATVRPWWLRPRMWWFFLVTDRRQTHRRIRRAAARIWERY